jgi:hypothetical protein
LPDTVQLESELGLGKNPVPRHELARRLDIAAIEIPDDETNWQDVREDGMTRAVERCARNAAATAGLWLRSCLTRGTLSVDDHEALADQLSCMVPVRTTDAA